MQHILLYDMLILLGFSVIIVFLLQRMKLPSILGFLITGIIIGPYSLSLITGVEIIELIAEIGVILLLFVVGMELSIKQLMSMKKTVFIGGFLQVGLTIAVATVVYMALGASWNEAVFIGFLFSLSSTAIVLKIFQDRNEISTQHGRNALAILIFQDIIVVPMMLFTPLISGQSSNVGMSILILLLKSLGVVFFTIISARYIVPKLMHSVAKTRNKELFLLTTIAICFAVAYLTAEAGLSLALGAFLAGLIISESEYSHQATSIILPFRELFTGFFFISIGMLLDLNFFVENMAIILIVVLLVFLLKSTIISFAMAVLKYPPKTILMTGFSLFQIGEFAFILSKVGIEYNLLSEETNQYFLAISIVSMFLTPFVILFSESIVNRFLDIKIVKKVAKNKSFPLEEEVIADYEDHLVIIGYGITGSNLAKAAKYSDIPYIVIEFNAETVKKAKAKGENIIFGDATQKHLLEAVHISTARAVVVVISDDKATQLAIRKIREVSPAVYLLARTRYVNQTAELLALGADEVIPEEFETSIEIFSRVLHELLVPENDIVRLVDSVRANNYNLLQSKTAVRKSFSPAYFPNVNIVCLRVAIDSGEILSKSLKEIGLRTKYGVNILSISRDEETIEVHSDEVLKQGDLLFVYGKPEAIDHFFSMINV